jgi:hypothetical protein
MLRYSDAAHAWLRGEIRRIGKAIGKPEVILEWCQQGNALI